MTTWEDYQDAFCPPESIPSKFGKKYTKHWCSRQETNENGTLALRFERFVQDYDGLQPWDMHLHLQVSLLRTLRRIERYRCLAQEGKLLETPLTQHIYICSSAGTTHF